MFNRKSIISNAMLLSIILLFISCGQPLELIIENEQLRSYSVEELIEVYHQNQEDFQHVADIILENDAIKQIMLNSQEEVVSIYTETKSDCFTEEDWSEIEELFRLTGMNRIERSIKSGKDVIKFLYRNSNFTTKLFYCVTTDEEDLLYHKQWTSIFQKIDEHWWVGYYHD